MSGLPQAKGTTAGRFDLMLANQASSTPPITTDSSDQMMQDGAGRLWTSLGQSPGLKMAWRRCLSSGVISGPLTKRKKWYV